jgi:hypothetical protein
MEPVSIPHPIRVHLSSVSGIYTVINYTVAVMYCQTSSKTLVVPVADFKSFAGGLNNEQVSPGEKEHFLQTIGAYSKRDDAVKIVDSVRRSATMLDYGERHHLKVKAHKTAFLPEVPSEPEPDRYMLGVVSTLFKEIADLKTELKELRKEIGSKPKVSVYSDEKDEEETEEDYESYQAMMESETERLDEQRQQDLYDYQEEMERQENEYAAHRPLDFDDDLPF